VQVASPRPLSSCPSPFPSLHFDNLKNSRQRRLLSPHLRELHRSPVLFLYMLIYPAFTTCLRGISPSSSLSHGYCYALLLSPTPPSSNPRHTLAHYVFLITQAQPALDFILNYLLRKLRHKHIEAFMKITLDNYDYSSMPSLLFQVRPNSSPGPAPPRPAPP
jgi:hypothetical protein